MRAKADEAMEAAKRASEIAKLNAAEAAKAVQLAAKGTAERAAELLRWNSWPRAAGPQRRDAGPPARRPASSASAV